MAKSAVQPSSASNLARTAPPALDAIQNAEPGPGGSRKITSEAAAARDNKMVAGVPLMAPKPPALNHIEMEAQLKQIMEAVRKGEEIGDVEQETWQAIGSGRLRLSVMQGGYTRFGNQQMPYPPIDIDFGKSGGFPSEMYTTPSFEAEYAREVNRRILAGGNMEESAIEAKAFVAFKIKAIKEHLRNATYYHPEYADILRNPETEKDEVEDAAIAAGLAAMERKAKKSGKKIDIGGVVSQLAALDTPRDSDHPRIRPGMEIPGVAR